MHSVDEVLAAIKAHVRPVEPVRMNLRDSLGCVLAEGVDMAQDSPPFDRALVDGFAVRSLDAGIGAELKLVGRVDAGSLFGGVLGPGQCVAINTGAVIPTGADGVLMVEQSEKQEGFIRVLRAVACGDGMQRRGSDARAGQRIMEAGTRLGAAQLAACAAAGVEGGLPVRKIRAAVLTTGDELVDPAQTPGPGQLRNSNHPMLCALVSEALGGMQNVVDLGTSGDDKATLRSRMQSGLDQADLLLVCGGMSMGTKDLAPAVMRDLGIAFHVEKVRMKPGKPFVFGTLEMETRGSVMRKYVVGLPGNPVSAYVTFQRFVREVMALMLGRSEPGVTLMQARTSRALEANGDREFYQPCILRQEHAAIMADILPWKSSADLFTLARAGGLVIRPTEAPPLPAGGQVLVLTW